MKNKLNLAVALVLTSIFSFAQTSSKSFTWNKKPSKDNVVMTWNKTTPEQEMKDDIKALAEYGVTIKYSNVKRNEKREITSIDVSFEDKNGNKGALSYKNNKPISTIKFFKQDDEIGFGEPENAFSQFNPFANFNNEDDIIYGLDYFPNLSEKDKINFKSRTIIKRDDREPLVIEDGKVIEGGNDYSKEEIDEILNRSKEDLGGNGGFKQFNYRGNQDFSEELQQIQKQLDELKDRQKSFENKEEKAVEEIDKTTDESEQPKKEVEKKKTTLKVKKA